MGLEDDPDFWNMTFDTSSVQATDSPPKKEDKTAGIFHTNSRPPGALLSGLRCCEQKIQTYYLPGSCKRLGL